MAQGKNRKLIKVNKKKTDLVFGTRSVIESIKSGNEIEKLLVQKNLTSDPIRNSIQLF